jgi:hypothetical protein
MDARRWFAAAGDEECGRGKDGSRAERGVCGRTAQNNLHSEALVGMKTDRIRTDITDIVFVFIFISGFGFEYG